MIGVGRIGAFHARGLIHMQGVERLTIADVDHQRARSLAAEIGADLAESPEAVFKSEVDAIVIAAATPAHATLLHMAADAGLPAFCEKPIALDLAATDSVIDHIERTGILVQIGFQRRFDAGYRAAREAVRSGSLGDVHLMRFGTHDPAPPPADYIPASGGIWRDLAIHDFDIAPWVLGRDVVAIYADGEANAPDFGRHDDVDAAAAVLRFAGATIGVFTGSRNDPRGYDVRMELFGLADSVAVGWDGRTPMRSLEPGVVAPRQRGYADFIERFEPAYRAELEAFLASVRHRSESLCSPREARRALVVALAADRSRRERRPVAVDEMG